jgi:Lrp/AsnC family transcriptional regulator, regulator for asnA, asnC and gidA
MDSLDYLILGELLKDATMSFVEIAKKVGTTPHTVRRRYEKMKTDGIIWKSIVSIDLSKLGYQGKVVLLMTLAPNANKPETIAYIRKIPNVMVVAELIGPFDMLAIAPVTDLKSIQMLVSEAQKAPSVNRVEISCLDNTDFPISSNFGKLLSEKSYSLATT